MNDYIRLRSSGRLELGAFLVLAAVSTLVITFLVARSWGDDETSGTPRPVTARGELAPWEQSVIRIFDGAAPSVVHVSTSEKRIYRRRLVDFPKGTGTGIVWNESGHIVTNYHVVKGGNHFEIRFLGDDEPLRATVVGAAANYDLAVLKLEDNDKDLRPLPIGSSHDLQVGQFAMAIGNPFGLQHSCTTGVISKLGHQVILDGGATIDDAIQTDAAINPGNSGGPLLDSAGRLIGVNTAIHSTTGQSSGIGFSVPVDTVNWVVPQLIAQGQIGRPRIGASLIDSGLLGHSIQGASIMTVEKDGPAAMADLRGAPDSEGGGDIIVRLGKYKIRRVNDVLVALGEYRPGDRVKIEFVRGRRVYETELTLAAP